MPTEYNLVAKHGKFSLSYLHCLYYFPLLSLLSRAILFFTLSLKQSDQTDSAIKLLSQVLSGTEFSVAREVAADSKCPPNTDPVLCHWRD